jgi:hypothetical protein
VGGIFLIGIALMGNLDALMKFLAGDASMWAEVVSMVGGLIGGGAMLWAGRAMSVRVARYARYLAVMGDRESVPVEEAEGRLCAEYVYCYPPGVPALVPGERIDAQCLSYLEEAESCGTAVVHSVCGERGRVACLKRFS